MANAHLIIIEIMCWRDLHATGTKFRIDVVIGDNRYDAICQWQIDRLANQVLVTLVIRVHRNRCITEHGLGSGCRNGQMRAVAAATKRVAYMPQVALFFFVQDFEIR